MRHVNHATLAGCLLLVVSSFGAVPAFAQGSGSPAGPNGATCDMSGEWTARSREDWEDRALMGTHLGDYTGMPINDAARQFARSWDASILSLPTEQAIPHPGQYFMRGPGPNFRMEKVVDLQTQDVLGYAVLGMWGRADRMIWTDGRPHPPEFVEHTWSGFSTAVCERGMLKVTTDHYKFGYHRRNGIPASSAAKVTEYFVRHGDQLTHVQFTEDPMFLEEPLVRTTDFEINRSQNVGAPGLGFEVVDEVATWPKGYVPSYPLGELHDDFARSWGIPYEATQGGKDTIYPEYFPRVNQMLADLRKAKASAPASGNTSSNGTKRPAAKPDAGAKK